MLAERFHAKATEIRLLRNGRLDSGPTRHLIRADIGPERTVDAGNETDIRGARRQASSAVPPTPMGRR